MTTIGIAGAGGHLGQSVATKLLDQGSVDRLVLVTRNPKKIARLAGGLAEVRHGDYDQPSTLGAALAGVDTLLLISTDEVGRRVPQHLVAIEGARRAGVSRVVYTSVPNPALVHPSGPLAAEHFVTEEAIKASGMGWTFLRNGLYTDMQADVAVHAVAGGKLYSNAGDGLTAYVTREDCAAAAAAALTQDGHKAAAYDITGPSLKSVAQLVEVIQEVSGAPVELVAVDDQQYTAGLTATGLPEERAKLVAGIGQAIREGLLGSQTSAVKDLTGRAATSVEEHFAAHRHELEAAVAR